MMLSSGIRFDDWFFTEPTWFADWRPPRHAGLFVILSPDSNWAPKPYQPLYFGEFGNNAQEPLLPETCAWMLGPANRGALFVSVLPMPFSTTAQRLALRNELLRAYNPISQPAEMPEAGKKPSEQQLLQLLASVHQLFEPAADPGPRRRIGFLP